MDFDKLKDMAGDPRFISGIYNYCDRWCERCEFTSRCLNAAMREDEETEGRDPASHDIQNQAFWDKLHGIFQQTIEMIRKDAAEQGIDLDMSPDEIKAFEKEEGRKRREAKNHPASRAAWKYITMVDKWFEENKALFEEEEQQLNRAFLMELPGQDPEEEAALVQDAIEVIGWYQHQIYVKLQRALHQDEFDDILDDDGKPYPRDCDGSAKVALLGIDRSIEAWSVLRRYLTTASDSILSILAHLDRLRKRIEATFPNARAFVRHGFDGPIPPPEA